MAIVSSTFALGVVQSDGRRECVERHTDSEGVVHIRSYLSSPSDDNQAIMTARAVRILDHLKDSELQRAIFVLPWNYVLVHTTNNELAAYVRQLYRNSTREILALVAKRILEWINNGRFTDTQVRTAFGLDAVSWTLLKTKMQDLVAKYEAVKAAEGE